MSKNLYVKNFGKGISNEQLSQKLKEFGRVRSVRIETDNVTFESKGSAWVEMETREEALLVISQLNGTNFQGKELSISAKA